MPLFFLERTYHQENSEIGMFGRNWAGPYTKRIDFVKNSIGEISLINMYRGNGKTIQLFRDNNKGTWRDLHGNTVNLGNENGVWFFTDISGVTENYNEQGQLTALLDINFQPIFLIYEEGRLVSVVSDGNQSMLFKYNDFDLISEVIISDRTYQYSYNKRNLLSQVTLPDGTTKTYKYSNEQYPFALTEMFINGSLYGKWVYDNDGKAISSEHADGVDKHLFSYNDDGSTTLTNPLGKKTTYYFDFMNGKKVITHVEGHKSSYCQAGFKSTTYDSYGFDDKVESWDGVVTDYDYNSRGLIEKITYGYGSDNPIIVEKKWHPFLSIPLEIKTATTATQFTYDEFNYLVNKTIRSINSDSSRTWKYSRSFHENGKVRELIEDGPIIGNEDKLVSKYDKQGNLIEVVNTYNKSILYGQYNEFGQPGFQTDANGVFTEFEYDLKGRKVRSIKHLSEQRITEFKYNSFDQVVETILPDGNKVQYFYDKAYRKIGQFNADGSREKLGLDNNGNVTKITVSDKKTRSTDYIFDGLSQVRQISKENEVKSSFEYDLNGNIISQTDGLGNTVYFSYDQHNRKIRKTDAEGGITKYYYNHQGQETRVIDANGNTTHYEYNDFGELIRLQSPDTGITHYQYDDTGSLVHEIRSDGSEVRLNYDLLGRIIEKRYVSPLNSTLVQSFEYDNCDYGMGLLCKVTDNSGTTVYGYDASGNRYREIVTIAGKQYITQRQFDIMDRLIEETYPSGNIVTYKRNRVGRITSILVNNQVVASNIQYDAGKATSWDFANDQPINISFDLQGRVAKVNAGNQQQLSFAYSANDNITSIINGISGESNQYGYDSLSRLTQENDTGYQYDALGNRTQRVYALDALLYGYDVASNRLQSAGEQTVETDALGNITQFGEKQYSYSAENRLSEFSQGQISASYIYNHLNQRVSKQVNGQTAEHFIYNELGQFAGKYQGSQYREYIYLNGMPLVLIDGDLNIQDTIVSFVASDHLGRPEIVTSKTGEIVWQANNHAFGRDILVEKIKLNLGFPGQYYDAEKDSWYNWHRDYDANLGRYLQSDPIGISGGINTYLYSNANGLRYFDFTGMAPCSPKCLKGISTAKQYKTAIIRAKSASTIVEAAAKLHGIPPSLLFAVGIRETGFQNVKQTGGGDGRGVFQIDIGKNPHVSESQAMDMQFSANFAANMLSNNKSYLQRKFTNFNAQQLLQATAASYNFGTGNISGNPNTIDKGSSHNNYGSNILDLMDCFRDI